MTRLILTLTLVTDLPELHDCDFSISITIKEFECLFKAVNVLHCHRPIWTEALRSLRHAYYPRLVTLIKTTLNLDQFTLPCDLHRPAYVV